MRRNNTLAAAITATLALTASAGGYAEQFQNATANLPVFDPPAPNTATRLYPDPDFDFLGPNYVPAPSLTGGTPFATELFGSGTLTLPTPNPGTGEYMAVVYTIDGTVEKDFEMTFSVDKGRFAAALLGVRSGKVGGDTITWLSAGLSTGCAMSIGNVATPTLTAVNQVFRFDSVTDTAYPYQVSASAGGVVTFWQLGNKANCPATGVVAGTSKIFTSTDISAGFRVAVNATTGVVVHSTTAESSLQRVSTGNATLVLGKGDASKFTTGWRYMCGSTTETFANTVPVFEVKGTTTFGTGGTSDGLLVSVLPVTTVGTGGNQSSGFSAGGECLAPNTIYRVNTKGDTQLSVDSVGKFTMGKSYKFTGGMVNATDSGGTDAATGLSNVHTTTYRVTAVDTTKGTITVEPPLAVNALLHSEAAYDTGAFATGGQWNTGNVTAATVVGKAVTDAVNNTSFSVLLKASTTGLTLFNNDQIMLLYKLTDLSALAAADEVVKMKVDLKVPLIGVVVNPTRELTVARSVQAIEANISPTSQTTFISVSSNMTQFKGTGESFENSFVAKIGRLVITDASKFLGTEKPVREDAVTPFEIDSTKVLADASKLTVTNGQFSASTRLPGKVYIKAGASEMTADEVTQDAQGVWSATWTLNSGKLRTIINADKSYIQIRADGNTQINSNTEDQLPHGKLDLKFNKVDYRQDITREGDLLRIPRDGIVCTVYNIAPPFIKADSYGKDVTSIRFTNDSNVSDKLRGTLIDMDGNVLYEGLLFGEKEIKGGETLRIDNNGLARLKDGKTPDEDPDPKAWEGRAILRIQSNLPKMEVMAMVRQNGVPAAPLSNLSTGAKGTSCENQ